MLNLIPYDMLIKYAFYILGPAIIIIGAFIAGIRHADKNALIDRLDAERELRQDINKAEQLNQKTEEKRNETINDIRDAGTIDKLIKLWRQGPWSSKGGD